MPVESWIKSEDAPEMAASATAMIDAALTGSGLERDTYWAAVRKGYNTPYNAPPPRKRAAAESVVTIAVTTETVPVSLIAQAATGELHAS